ncbi:ABC transporter permease [Achromobacter sp. AONIH1]|uniref:ABC transporter permease subunit n=1 Tax=Achromobacter sp. AONIH1 TaxID=1758194 RepID=UPI001F284BA1|nr:ABC transporter permease [Achromobacter sp. AONIH1]
MNTDLTGSAPMLRRVSQDRRAGAGWSRHRGLVTAIAVFALLLATVAALGNGGLSYFDLSFLASGGATLAIAAMGATLVILTGGFDLSAGAVISLVNVALALGLAGGASASPLALTAAGIAIGMAAGAFNGFFVAVLRLQPIVVTLSTMFILQGAMLLIMDKPGGAVAPALAEFYMGDAVPGLVPMPLALLATLGLAWAWFKRTRAGVALYAVGSDAESARAAGLRVDATRFLAYVMAGGLYGLAGVFLSAQTGSGDPLVGNPLLLSLFAAVVVGGTRLGGGRGGPMGSVFGAYILMIVVNILLVLNVSAYFSTVAEGLILIAAALAAAASRDSTLALQLRAAAARWRAWRAGMLPRQLGGPDRRLALPEAGVDLSPRPGFAVRHAQTLRYALPAVVCLLLVLVVTQWTLGRSLTHWGYWNALIVLSSFLAILALGQGAVILTGGLDLSLPWTIGLSGILFAGMTQGMDAAMPGALAAVLLVGGLIGLVNGLAVAALGLSPIVATLAVNGILQGLALLYSGGTPAGFAPPLLRGFMTGQVLGVTPVVPAMALFAVLAVLLLSHTAFGRRVYAVGNSVRAARLAGVPVGRTLVCAYVLSGLCAALAGILLTGFSGQASLGMGDDYLLPSIAAVVVGGGLITGGRGHYLGMLAGVLLLTALQTLLAGSNLPYATRAILYGLVVLGAVIALRERRA